ncbi:MAG: tetratricopeptide repeat protein [Verrucomicrobiales bacterium]
MSARYRSLYQLLVIWLIAPFIAITQDAPGETPSIEAIMNQVRPSLVTVLQDGRDGVERGIGSGFVVSEDGLIATNLHVTGEGRPIRVRLTDGSEPKVVAVHAWDRKLDLVVLRVDRGGLQPLAFAPTGAARQGVETLALGNPQGLEFSVTQGVVSGLRDVNGIEMIQAAVPIERGNSGGPLIDRMGRVLGVITLKAALTENLGFAVPVENVGKLLEKPNTVPMIYWQRIGRLNPRLWSVPEADEGVSWRQRAGVISAQGAGAGFGGRALCFSKVDAPDLPYDISVEVKLDDESGAAGIMFGSDGADRHYGFYPTSGQLRLTRFDGPTVYSWNILEQTTSTYYRAGDWNHLRVRLEVDRIRCYLNGHLVIESNDQAWRTGSAGLCKFRETQPVYRRFEVAPDLETPGDPQPEIKAVIQQFASGGNPINIEALFNKLTDLKVESSVVTEAASELRKRADEMEEIALRLHHDSVSQSMMELFARDDADVDLLQAALLVAYLDNPSLIVGDYVAELDRMAVELDENLEVATLSVGSNGSEITERQKLELLGLYLFEQNGFHGSRSDYRNKSNSYLNEVLDDREGLPISLGIVYMELGRRIGLKIEGVPLPGHFIVRHQPARPGALAQLVDVFDGGKLITEEQAAELVMESTGLTLAPEHLERASNRQIIVRVLRNLIGVAIEKQEVGEALSNLNLLLAIAPEEPQERLSRAILHFQSGRPESAREDIDWLIENEPVGIDVDRLREWRASLPGRPE